MGVRRVLMIDDDVRFLKLLETTFSIVCRDINIEFTYFTEGLSLLDYYEEHVSEVEIVISDYDMPEINGSDLYSVLKLMDPELKFILVTGGNYLDLEEFRLRSNVYGVYEKPIESILRFTKEVLSHI